jgi:long-chain acyl-CoA synthetase
VVAAVVPRAGVGIDPQKILAWCRERLAGYKIPRRLVAVAALPRSEIGKVLRRQVRDSLPGALPDARPHPGGAG